MTKTNRWTSLLLLVSTAVQAQSAGLLPAQPGDLVPARARAVDRAVPAAIERMPLAYAQPLAADAALTAEPAIHRAESREYWQRVDAAALRQGYPLALTSAGALILLSPTPSAAAPDAAQIRIVRGAERATLDQAGEALADTAALRAAGMQVATGALGFRLRDGYEADAALQVEGARGEYLLHVAEPRSHQLLTLSARRDTLHAGDTVEVDLALEGGARIGHAAALLVAPDGNAFDLDLRSDGTTARGSVRIPDAVAATAGLWDVRTTVAANDGTRAFQRDARTAIAVSVPTARIAAARRDGKAGRGTTTIDVDLDVASAGRYEARGVLYGTDAQGRLVPAAAAQSAAWFEPGSGRLRLAFPASAAGLSAPFELRDLRLNDQTVPALLERRARALRIER
ncbi:MAG TPA: DUF4785 domain-containing protein [Dokdonella sp.]|uniref:DUF4785 domain-containing protein n=1 Tax=Dokdonella sp. TaxID=2291710 RepID=UPI002CBF1B66|nr:DUF4785 domain-containing protein [Dokdonella sp.]HUD42132.1 DUF4785 domain-containing protein [Dokdonella sp.]